MAPLARRLADLVVTPGSFAFMETGSTTRQTMSRVDIESVPQFGEDIFRAVNRMPGLSSSDYSAHFSIRGGRDDETLILLDGLELYEPYHLKDFNEGAISIVDVETIEGVELLTGGFSAKYGDKRSGVFSVTSKTPKDPHARVSVGASLLNARAMGEGTFGGGKGSWLISGRRAYLDLILSLLPQNDLPSPSYYDAFAAIRYNVHPRHTLGLNALLAGDRYTFNSAATTGFQDSIQTREVANNGYGNSYVWLTGRSLLGQRLAIRSLFSVGRVTAHRDGREFFTSMAGASYDVTNRRDFTVLGAKQDAAWELSDRALVELGYDLRGFNADYTLDRLVYQNPDDPTPDPSGFYPLATRTALARTGTTLGAYLSSRLQVTAPVALELGVRYDRASYTGDRDLSPRVNLLVQLGRASSMRAGFGHYRQRQAIADFAALDGLGRYFPSELSKQWTLGFERLLSNDGVFRIEGYRKTGSRLRPIYRNWRGGLDVFPETSEDRLLVYPRTSTSSGVELYHSRDFRNGFSVQASYAFAVVNEVTSRIDNVNGSRPVLFSTEHPWPQDQRHALHFDLAYRPKGRWSAQASYAFHGGWPATHESLETVSLANGGTDSAVLPDSLYGGRLPSYHRLDLRLTRRVTTVKGSFRFFFEISNLTNHGNLFGYDYFREPDASGRIVLHRDGEKGFPILPSLGVAWTRNF